MKNPVMYAIGYKYEEDIVVNFVKEEDHYDLTFECLLPSRKIAEQYIEDVLGGDYMIIPVEVVSFRNGITQLEYDIPEDWRDDYDEDDE